VGYEEGGVLTESVRRRPYQVLLLDEFEKGHRDVWNLLLQLFDEGHLSDSHGRKVDFRNVIVVMTSNLGAHVISELPPEMTGTEPEVQEAIMDVVRHTLSPGTSEKATLFYMGMCSNFLAPPSSQSCLIVSTRVLFSIDCSVNRWIPSLR